MAITPSAGSDQCGCVFLVLGIGAVCIGLLGVVLALTTELRHRGKAIMEPIDPREYETRRQALDHALQHCSMRDGTSAEDVVAEAETFRKFLSDATARVQ